MNKRPDPSSFPHLNALRLSERDLDSLAQQGFVRPEPRGQTTIYKLRFRCKQSQRQCVRYISSDREIADAVSAELARLQQPAKDEARLRRLNAEARRVLRQTKRRLQPLLVGTDFRFYGYEIREQRRCTRPK
jgi:hypothetical protein